MPSCTAAGLCRAVLQKEKYVSVVQHLESAPAQDVVPLLQHLEQELRLAVRTGNAAVGTVSQAQQHCSCSVNDVRHSCAVVKLGTVHE